MGFFSKESSKEDLNKEEKDATAQEKEKTKGGEPPSLHEGPRPETLPPKHLLPPTVKLIACPYGAFIERSLWRLVMREGSVGRLVKIKTPTGSYPIYVPSVLVPVPEYITKSGPVKIYRNKAWNNGSLSMTKDKLKWQYGSMAKASFHILEFPLVPPDFLPEGSANTELVLVVRGKYDPDSVLEQPTSHLLSFSSPQERNAWYFSIAHNFNVYHNSDEMIADMVNKWKGFFSSIGYPYKEVNWRHIFDMVYTD